MDEFMLILRHQDGSKLVSPEQMQIWMKQTMDWVGGIAETIGGYMIVRAESVEEAVEFAKGCPVLQGEANSVEVRRIARRDGVH